MGRAGARNPVGREARAGERGDHAATERDEDYRGCLSDRTSCTRESSPRNTSFDVLGLASAMRSSGRRSSGEAVEHSSLPSRRLVCHRTAILRPLLPANKHFATAHQADETPVRRRGPQAPLVTVFACICSESALDPRSLVSAKLKCPVLAILKCPLFRGSGMPDPLLRRPGPSPPAASSRWAPLRRACRGAWRGRVRAERPRPAVECLFVL